MPVRFYLVPTSLEFIPEPGSDGTIGYWYESSKYFNDLQGIQYSRRKYGDEGVDLVASNLTDLDHGIIMKNADVVAFPEKLDAIPSDTERNQAIIDLEARRIPADWIQPAMTWRQILETLRKIVQTVKNLAGGQHKTGQLFKDGAALDTPVKAFPAELQQKLSAYADSKDETPNPDLGMREAILALAAKEPSATLAGVKL